MIRVGKAIWLAIRFDWLALEVIDPGARPVAVIEHHRVYLSNCDALDPGMSASTAQAVVPDLLAIPRRPEREREALELLALWAYRVTPTITIAAENALLLEIGSCQKLYGDLSQLLLRLQAALERRGHRVALGVAHSPKAAWLLAANPVPPALREGSRLDGSLLEKQLSAIAITALPIDAKIHQKLTNMGIETLGRLLSFDAALLGKRLGAALIQYVQQLTGHLPDVQTLLVLPLRFERSLTFLDGIHNRQTLRFPMKTLAQGLSDYLIARQLHCRAFEWRFSDAYKVCATMPVELSRAHHKWPSFLDLTLLKLDQVELPEAVFGLTLFTNHFLPAGAASFQLFAEDNADDEGHALMDRLASRLGKHALFHISATASLWPETATQTIALSEEPLHEQHPTGERPTWLLPTPEPLHQRDQQLVWQKPLDILRGPERLESPPACGPSRHRDYYVAREQTGRLCWIFKELDSGRWFVHGLFA